MAQSWNLGTKQPPVVNPQPRAGRDGKRGAVLGRIRASWCDGVAKLRLSGPWCDAFLEWTDAPKSRKQGSCVRRSATPAVRQGAGAGSCGCQNLIAGPHQPPPAGEDGFPIDLSAFVSKPDPVWILISETCNHSRSISLYCFCSLFPIGAISHPPGRCRNGVAMISNVVGPNPGHVLSLGRGQQRHCRTAHVSIL